MRGRDGRGRRAAAWIPGFVRKSASDWELSVRAMWAVALVPIVVTFIGMGTAAAGIDAYRWLVAEGRVGENLQVCAFGGAALLAFLTSRRLQDRGARVRSRLFLIMAIGLLFVAGEEVSWGQRMFGWGTPDPLDDINRQGETNVHNVFGVETAFEWAVVCAGIWGALLPFLLLRDSGWLSRRRDLIEGLVPHAILALYFAGPLVWRLYRTLGPRPTENTYFWGNWSEVMELNLAFGILLFVHYEWRRAHRAGSSGNGGGSGLTVALLGPDGAGKTTMSKALAAHPALRARRIYMGTNPEARNVGLPGAERVRRARVAREGFSAVRHGLVFLHQLADHWYRYALADWHRARGGIVVFDRYVHPPPDRSGDGLARRVRARIFRTGAPTPDLVVVLDAPAEVLAKRKGEHGVARMEQRRRDVERMASRSPGAVVLNVDRAPAEVEDALLALIRSRLEENRDGGSRTKGSRWAARR